MKKWILLIVFLLTACGNENSVDEPYVDEAEDDYQTAIEAYIAENELQVIERHSFDDEVISYQTDEEIGLVHFIRDEFDTERRSVSKMGDDIELLHIGNEDQTYFGVIVRNQAMFEESTEIQVTVPLSAEPFVFDTTGDYSLMMVKYIDNMSITSCAADGFKVLKGEEILYEESFVPT